MIQVPLLLAYLFRYRSQVLEDELAIGPERCDCGQELRTFQAKRYLYLLKLELWSREVLAKRCMACPRFYLQVGPLARWTSPIAFLALACMIWLCLAALPIIFFAPTFQSMHEIDWEILGAWSIYGLLAGVLMYATGRAVWRRFVNAAKRRLIEVDQHLGFSV